MIVLDFISTEKNEWINNKKKQSEFLNTCGGPNLPFWRLRNQLWSTESRLLLWTYILRAGETRSENESYCRFSLSA